MIESIKAFAADNMVGFSLADFPVFLFQIFYAALLALLLVKVYPGWGQKLKLLPYVVAAIALAALTAMVKHSVALSVVALGVLLLVRFSNLVSHFEDGLLLLLVVVVSVAIGAGMGIPATLTVIVILIVRLILGREQKEE